MLRCLKGAAHHNLINRANQSRRLIKSWPRRPSSQKTHSPLCGVLLLIRSFLIYNKSQLCEVPNTLFCPKVVRKQKYYMYQVRFFCKMKVLQMQCQMLMVFRCSGATRLQRSLLSVCNSVRSINCYGCTVAFT